MRVWIKASLGAFVMGGAIALIVGCAGVTKTLSGGQAIAYANAVRAEDKARVIEDPAKRRQELEAIQARFAKIVQEEPEGNFANRARYRAALLKKELTVPGGRNYDEAIALLQEIVDRSSSGYRASLARSEIAAIRKNRQELQDAQRVFDNTPENASEKRRLEALEALYDVARAYESLRDYETAIQKHRLVIGQARTYIQTPQDPFYKIAVRSQMQIGNIYFYSLYNYERGWPEFVAVSKNYSEAYEAAQADSILKRAKASLDSIHEDQEYVRSKRKEIAAQYKETGRRVNPNEMYGVYGEQVAQTWLNIAQTWERDPLRNLPNAIDNYKQLADELWNQGYIASDALYQVGKLYQDNGEYEEAISAYADLFERFPQTFRRDEAVYNRAVCLETIREFEKAYREYQAAFSLGADKQFYRSVEQKLRQFELDEDGDGYKFYQEQQAGTSDKDPNSHPGKPKPVEPVATK